jgi:hypothetical protein
LTAIQALTITGVDRKYDEPPASIDISDGVAAFPEMPSGDRGEQVATCAALGKSRAIIYVIIVEAAGQGTQAQNYAKLAALMDNLETALDSLQDSIVNFVEYEITTTGNYPLGQSEYWAIVASVTGSSV